MSAAAAPATPSSFRGSTLSSSTSVPLPAPQRRPGVDDAALAELRNAGATYDYFRRKGLPAQFWEMLRLARNRRSIVAPSEGEAPPPAPDVEALILRELESIRRQFAPLVRDLRRYLRKIPELPEPCARFEMALAFLLASAREQQAVAKWLAEPGRHESKAAEKLRSLAAITDPYREALLPWALPETPVEDDQPEKVSPPAAVPPSVRAPSAPSHAPAPPVDAKQVEVIRQAVKCREILRRLRLESELWETLLLVTMDPESSRAALESLARHPAGDPMTLSKADKVALETLYDGVTDLRQMYAEWVHAIRTVLSDRRLAPEDPRAFEVGLALLLCTPGAQDRLDSWLEDPSTCQEETLGQLHPWIRRAQGYLAAMK